jgi:hypothetical protein
VAEAARHPDAVGAHEIGIEVVVRIVVEPLGIPPLAGAFVEVRIREQPKAHDPGGLAVVRADRHGRAARADLHARVPRRVGEWIGRAGRIALIDPQPEMIGIRLGRLAEARLVDEPEIVETIVAAVLVQVSRRVAGLAVRVFVDDARMRRDGLQQIEGAETVARKPVP